MVLQVFYWKLRALGEPIRLMLEHLRIEYENKHPDGETWADQKHNLGCEYPNLPYLVDGEVKVSQSFAVMRYITRKFCALGGDTEEEKHRVDTAEGFCGDLRGPFLRLWFDPEFESKKVEYFKQLPDKLKSLENVLGKYKWAGGDKLTYVDFGICECLDHHEMCQPGCLKPTPNVQKYYETFFALPNIAAYRRSNRFQAYPVAPASARWGYSKL